jgi:hypothetical protein
MSNKQFEWTEDRVAEFAEWYRQNQGVPLKGENWGKDLMEVFKQDWEKRNAPIPEYEILSFDGSKFSEEQVRAAAKFGEYDPNGIYVAYALQHNFPIHSVRRLSDGEVFSVGDQIDATGEKCRITGFKVLANWEGGLMVCTDETPTSGSSLRLVTKLPTPQPLFTTEDGVDLFSISDTVYGVCPEGTWETRELGLLLEPNKTNWKWFAIEYNRDIYIRENKPCLSYKDVFDAFEEADVPYMNSKIHKALFEKVTAKL